MNKRVVSLLIALAMMITPAFAAGRSGSRSSSHRSHRSSSTSSRSKSVHVRGYTKKNGTHVRPYNRRRPRIK